MKADPVGQALRLGVALFIFSLTVGSLYLVGAAQSFSDETLRRLFQGLRWLTWAGIVVSWFGLVPWARKRRKQVTAAAVLGLGFTALFGAVLVWGSWIYPDSGSLPW